MSRHISFEGLFADPESEDAPVITAQVGDEKVRSFRYIIAGTSYGVEQLLDALMPLESAESAHDWYESRLTKEIPHDPWLDALRDKLLLVPKWEFRDANPDKSTVTAEEYLEMEGRFRDGSRFPRNELFVTHLLFEALALRADLKLCEVSRVGIWADAKAYEDGRWVSAMLQRLDDLRAELHVPSGERLLYESA